MRKRIINSNLFIAVIAVFISAITVTLIHFSSFEKTMYNQALAQASLLSRVIDYTNESDIQDILNDVDKEIESRFTLIDFDGAVVYDSDFDASLMDNHKDRPEVKEALNGKIGSAMRYSDTANKYIYYCAIETKTSGMVRIGVYADKVIYQTVISNLPVILLCFVVGFIICYFVSGFTTKKIVSTIENYDIENNKGYIYEELHSFINKINSQNNIINTQMQNLKNEKEKIETIFFSMQEAIIVCDENLNIIEYNSESSEMFNMQKTGLSFSKAVRHSKLQKAMHKALKEENVQGIIEHNQRYYQYTIKTNLDDKIQNIILVLLDITMQIENQQMRKLFVDNVTHELKTPLTSILGYAQLMTNGIARSEDTQKFLQIIEDNSQRLLEMVDDIIKLSNIEEAETLNKIPVDVEKIFKNTIKEVDILAENKNVKINFKSENCVIRADEGLLYDISRNLITNAIKYNKDNGEINIELQPIKSGVNITIQDTGIGISNNDIDKIFQRFYVVDKSRNRNISSTGLGLAIVKHAVESHNGRIKVNSVLEQGTTFKIYLPK